MQFALSLDAPNNADALQHDATTGRNAIGTANNQFNSSANVESCEENTAIPCSKCALLNEEAFSKPDLALGSDPLTTPACRNKNDISIVPTLSSAATYEWNGPLPPLSEKVQSRLAMLGVSRADFEFFINKFVGHRWQYIQRTPDGDWYSAKKRYLTDWHLVRHLAGDIVVGTGCRWDQQARDLRTSYIAIDLDHQGDDVDLRDRYNRVVAALGPPSYVFQSSKSGGLHVYFLLTRSESLHALRSFDGRRGDVIELLRAKGLLHEKGRMEVYPQGQYRGERGQQPRLRTPFGVGSVLLHPTTLQALAAEGPPSLIRARELFESGDVPQTDPIAWLKKRQALPRKEVLPTTKIVPVPQNVTKTSRPRRKQIQAARTVPSGHDPEKVERLLTVGLTDARQLHDAAIALAFHFRYGLALSEAEASARIVEWLDTHHNGRSRTYNASPAKARRQAIDVVRRVYRRTTKAQSSPSELTSKHAATWIPVDGLSDYEARSILSAFTSDATACDPSTGELLDAYKLRLLAFELLRRAKQYVLTFVCDALNSAKDDVELDEILRTVWPDRSQPIFVVISPAALRDGRGRAGSRFLKGIGRDTRWKYWRAIRHSGLFALQRPACSFDWARHAATYVVRLDFGALSPTTRIYPTLGCALNDLMSADELEARFTTYRQRQIRETCHPRINVVEDDRTARAKTFITSALRSRGVRQAEVVDVA